MSEDTEQREERPLKGKIVTLKPCPFCGDVDNEEFKPMIYEIRETHRYYVECEYCHTRAQVTCTKKSGAINWWNTRPRE